MNGCALAALVVLALLVAFDLFLHIAEVWVTLPWPTFKTRNHYAAFWIAYWAFGLAVAAFGIGSLL